MDPLANEEPRTKLRGMDPVFPSRSIFFRGYSDTVETRKPPFRATVGYEKGKKSGKE
jgi:hypothetical protein